MNPHDDEVRYWRDLAMRRGHEGLDPDYINSAIRDIYENNFRRSDHDIHQTRRSRTPHPHQAYTSHIPRAHTSRGYRGDEPHPRAQSQTRAPFLRPVPLPEEVVTPVIPPSTPRDHPSSTWTDYPYSGIQLHPLFQPPYLRPPPSFQQQPHSSHIPAYHRVTELNSARPSHTHQPPLNEGIRINPEPMLSNYQAPWHPPFDHNTPGTSQVPQPPPAPTSGLYAFHIPAHSLPYPRPYPYVPARTFRTGNTGYGQTPGSAPAPPPASAPVQQPPGPYMAGYLSGGWPLSGPSPWLPPLAPGVAPGSESVPQWSPGTWPPLPWPTDVPVRLAPWLIPNPVNPGVPQIEWDVSTHPTTARRVTGAHIILPLDSGGGGSTGTGIDREPATLPPSERIIVLCDVGWISQLWGPIVIERPGGRVTIRDLLERIYAFFQTHLTAAEVEYISSLEPNNYGLLVDAYQRRTTQRRLGVLRDWEWREGMRRVDCLQDRRWWWGVWVTYNSDETWHLNLGFMNPAHRNI
ncbi:hypothetical protein F5J12DRAFT_154272 [Pisolithus orientalis]|uniref:uncharacterized protein n=1 Tax=Pisolithus orientalis TaxID=936130 RepID=UPI00222430C2|nr:uncharacterized protein F5J12DRAFT_154272 [Pisolithus orientalis]KAI6003448.1 hypothetical protein F5J12DRAFT_154272 [Pisolithus orientalis]